MKKTIRRITGILLSVLLIAEMAVPAVAAEQGKEKEAPTITVSQEVLDGSFFYIANDSTSISERDKNTWLFTVGRGGSAEGESEVTVSLRDITALYGENYEAWVVGGKKGVAPAGHYSYVSIMADADSVEENSIVSEEEAGEYLTDVVESESEAAEKGDLSATYANTDNAIPPVELTVHFEAGEKEKKIAIKPIQSSKAEGDASFMMALTDPSEGMELSALNNILISIEDKSNGKPAEISFEKTAYYVSGDTAYITVTRKGSLNDTVSAYIYTEEDTASGYYDFSPVGAKLVFPFGVKTRTVEIPVNHLSDTEKSFYVGLSSKAGCTINKKAQKVKVTLAPCNEENTDNVVAQTDGDESAVNDAAAQTDSEETGVEESAKSNTVESSEADTSSRLNSFAGSARENTVYATADTSTTVDRTLDSNNAINLSALKIIGSGFFHGDGYIKLTTHGIDNDVASAVRLEYDTDPTYNSYAYDGYEINWKLDEGFWLPYYYFYLQTKKTKGDGWNVAFRYGDDDKGYDDGKKTRIYKSAVDPGYETEIGIINQMGSGSDLYIYSIVPIKRTFDIILQPADTKSFKGVSSVESAPYTGAELNNSKTTQKGVVYSERLVGDTVTVTATDANHYLRLAGLSVQDSSGNEITYVENKSASSDSVSFELSNDFLYSWGDRFEYEKNSSLQTSSKYDGKTYTSNGYTGKIYLKPDFRYRDVDLNILADDLGRGSFEEFPNTGNQLGWHMGDVLTLTGKISAEYSSSAEVSGYAYKIKKNSQTETVSGTSNFGSSGKAELKLDAEAVTLRPISTEKTNALVVEVSEADYEKFDHTKGIFAADSKYIKHNEAKGTYEITVIPGGSLVNTQLCLMLAYTKDKSSVPVWTEYGNTKKYSGTVFYHEAGSRAIENVITLGIDEANGISTKVHGYLYYANVNINTSRQAEGNFPASGQSISAAGATATSDEIGEFTTEELRAARGTYVRYLTGSNGATLLGDIYVNGGTLNTGIIQVPVQSANSVSVDSVSVEQGGYYLVNTIPLSGVKTTFRAGVTDNVDYYVGQKKYTEKITAVNFIVLDGTTLERKYIFKGKKSDNYAKDSTWYCEAGPLTPENTTWYGPGDYIYVEIKTDRVKADFAGADSATNEALSGAVYTPQYSGFSLISTDSYEAPEMEIGFPISAENFLSGDYKSFSSSVGTTKKRSFVTLPFIGSLDTQLRAAKTTWKGVGDYSQDSEEGDYDQYKDNATKSQTPAINFQITVEERPNGITRLKIGAAVTFSNSTEETISQTRASKFSAITGQLDGIFENGGGEDKGESDSKDLIYNNPKNASVKNFNQARFGGTSMTFSFLIGMYLDFGFVSEDDSIDGAEMKFLGLGVYFGVSGSIGYTQYFLIPVVSCPGYIGFTGSLAVMGSVGATGSPNNALSDQTESFVVNDFCENPEATINGILSLTGFIGVGVRGIVGVRGTGTFTFNAGADSTYPDLYKGCDAWGLDLTFTLGGVVDIIVTSIPFNVASWDLWQAGYYEYFKTHDGVEVSGQSDEVSAQSESETDLDTVEYTYQERTGGSEFTGSAPELQSTYVSEGKASEKEIVDNVYTHPSEKMVDLGNGKILMVYLDDDSTKADNQITSLYYTVYDKGFWSKPVKVQNDKTGDFYPNVTDCGDKVLITWVSAPDASAKTDIDRIMDLEIYTTFYDKNKGSLGEITRLTDDIYFDSVPQAVYDEKTDSIALYYTKNAPEMEKNSKGEWVVSEGTTYVEAVSQMMEMKYSMICYRLYENGKWTEKYYETEYSGGKAPNAINKGERYLDTEIKVKDAEGNDKTDPPIADFAVSMGYNGLAVYGYTVDMDSDMETDSDRELFIQVYNFNTHKTYKPIQLTDNTVSESLPQFTRSGGATRLFWLADNNALMYANITDLVKYGINNDGTLKDTVKEAVSGVSKADQKTAGDYDLSYHKVDLRHRDISLDASSTLQGYTVVTDSEDNLYVIWTNADYEAGVESSGSVVKMEREVYAAAMIDDGTGAAWSDPVQLTESGKVNDEIAAVIDNDDNLIIASARFDMSFDSSVGENENPLIQGQVDLVTTKLGKAGSVEVTGISLSDTTPMAGDAVDVSVSVKNTGLSAAKGYSLDLYTNSASGTKIGTATSSTVLLPGCSTTETFTWTLPSGFDGTKLYAVTKESGFSNTATFTSDPVRERATYEVTIGGSRQDGDDFYLDVNVENTGNKVSDAADIIDANIVCLYGNSVSDYGLKSDNLGQVKIGNNLKPGESKIYTIKLNATSKAFEKYGFIDVTVAVKTPLSDGSLITLSNVGETFVNQTAPTDLTLQIGKGADSSEDDGIVMGEAQGGSVIKNGAAVKGSVTVASGSTVSLKNNTNGIPDASEIVIASSDEGVVKVENGCIYAVGDGEAELTATVLPYGTSMTVPVSVDGNNAVKGFTDVVAGCWYADAVEWAVDNEITKGTSPTLFLPNAGCTRAQAVTFLWRAAGCPEADGSEVGFTDVKAGSYYEDAVAWAVSNGVTEGVSDTKFDPDAVCTRAHIVTFLWRSKGCPEIAGEKAAFTDVKADSWYTDAVFWAAEKGITTGTTATSFEPANKCTRAHIVTFLWRAAKLK